jgi:hypothetical protein
MQGTSKQAPLQLGRLSADDAERFAAMFRPAWELDDAPFAGGTKLSANEMDELAASGGIDIEIVEASAVAPHFPPRSLGSPPAAQSVEIQADPAPQPAPARPAAPQPVAARPPVPVSAPVAARPQPQAYAPPPRPISMTDDDLAPPKKSSMGIFIGVGVVVALVGAGVVAKFALGGGSDKTSTTTTQTATHEEARIPPPPAAVDTTPPVDTATAAKTTTAAVATTPVATAPVATTPPPPVTATHVAAGGATAPRATATAAATTKPIATTKPNKSGIVRDNPF